MLSTERGIQSGRLGPGWYCMIHFIGLRWLADMSFLRESHACHGWDQVWRLWVVIGEKETNQTYKDRAEVEGGRSVFQFHVFLFGLVWLRKACDL